MEQNRQAGNSFHKYIQLISYKSNSMEEGFLFFFFNKWWWNNWTSTGKNMNLKPNLKPHAKMYTKWITDLNLKHKTFIEKHRRKSLVFRKVSKEFSNLTKKARSLKVKINKSNVIKI